MAVVTGIIKFKGTIDDVSVYHHKHYGWLARRKGGPDPKKMKTQRRFAGVMANANEFGSCSRVTGLVRRGMLAYLKDSMDGRLNSRLTSLFISIKNFDKTSLPGQREILKGLQTKEGKAQLEGFELNPAAGIDRLLKVPYRVDKAHRGIYIEDLVPKKHFGAPKGATHVRLRSVLLGFDEGGKQKEISASPHIDIKLDNKPVSIHLKAPALNRDWSIKLHLLQVCFFEYLNGKEYPFPGGECNGMRIVGVSA